MRGLKIWTFRFAICARRSRRISSSLLPLNMLPATTSIHPAPALCATSISSRGASPLGLPYTLARCARSHLQLLLILAVSRADPDRVADVDVGRDVDDQPGFERRRLHLRARGGAVDGRRRVDDLQIDRDRQLDADRLLAVELHRDFHVGQDVVGVVAEDLTVEVDLLVTARAHEME